MPTEMELRVYSEFVAQSLRAGPMSRDQLADVADALDLLAEGVTEAVREYLDAYGTCPKTVIAGNGLEAMRGCLRYVRDEGQSMREHEIMAKLRDAHRNAAAAVVALQREGTAWHFPDPLAER